MGSCHGYRSYIKMGFLFLNLKTECDVILFKGELLSALLDLAVNWCSKYVGGTHWFVVKLGFPICDLILMWGCVLNFRWEYNLARDQLVRWPGTCLKMMVLAPSTRCVSTTLLLSFLLRAFFVIERWFWAYEIVLDVWLLVDLIYSNFWEQCWIVDLVVWLWLTSESNFFLT